MSLPGAKPRPGVQPAMWPAMRDLPPVGLVVVLVLLSACAPARVSLPQGDGIPLQDPNPTLQEATERCRAVQTLTVELSVSGRAGGSRLRGRVLAGLAAPDSARLEGVAPFGAPAFILVAQAGEALLLLPRDDRLVEDAPPEAILEALTGLRLDPGDLRALLVGCVTPAPSAVAGRAYGDEWIAVDLNDRATAFLRTVDGTPQMRAARLDHLVVEYSDFTAGLPRRLRVWTEEGTDLSIQLSQLETNVPLGPAVFEIQVPDDALPMTLEELRRAGPLGDRSES